MLVVFVMMRVWKVRKFGTDTGWRSKDWQGITGMSGLKRGERYENKTKLIDKQIVRELVIITAVTVVVPE